jgi:hypothetical protein
MPKRKSTVLTSEQRGVQLEKEIGQMRRVTLDADALARMARAFWSGMARDEKRHPESYGKAVAK